MRYDRSPPAEITWDCSQRALDWGWLLVAVLLPANWPDTMFMVMRANRRLIDTPPEAAWAEKSHMLKRRGCFQARRSSLPLVAISSARIVRDGGGKDVLRPRG